MSSIFTKILNGSAPGSFVYRDERVSAFMDIQPVNPGHVLVVPNKEVPYLSDLDDETAAHLFRIARRIAVALRNSGLKCEGVNMFLADGEAAGQEVFHVHLHIFPRYEGDGFGLKFGSDYTLLPERSELDRVAEEIRVLVD